MRVFKRKRRTPQGRHVPSRNWSVEFRDHAGAIHRIAAFSDRAASEALGRKVERLVALRSAGEAPDLELTRFISGLPKRVREKLGEVGVLARARVAGGRPIGSLLEEYGETLAARDRTESYIRKVVRRISKALEGSGVRVLPDLQAGRLERYLATAREGGLSIRTSNHYLAACVSFARWAMVEGYLDHDPFAGLKPLNARLDTRRERRALSFDDELPRLIRAAAEGPIHRGLDGSHRALVYRLAAETGLRVAELAALRVCDLDLEEGRPAISLPARAAKNRKAARLELPVSTAKELSAVVSKKLPQAPLLDLPRSFRDKATRWLRFDLEAAGIPYEDERGRVADFHALRASFVSGLMRSGANPRVVQTMARHASAEMTLGIYTKLGRDDERQALERLPALPATSAPQAEVPQATGTAGPMAFGHGPRNGPSQDAAGCTSVPRQAQRNAPHGSVERVPRCEDGGGGGSRTPVPESAPTRRLRA